MFDYFLELILQNKTGFLSTLPNYVTRHDTKNRKLTWGFLYFFSFVSRLQRFEGHKIELSSVCAI